MLRDNHSEYDRNETRGIPRKGKALLHGIAYCGECGRKMCVQYKRGAQYIGNNLRRQTGARVCQRLPADPVDEQVVTWFFEALSVAEIDAPTRVLSQADEGHDHVMTSRRMELDRLRYQARLAERHNLPTTNH